MKIKEFCNLFNVYITFDKMGYGKIYGLGSHPPKYMEKEDFFTPTSGGETGLLPCLVDDYYDYSDAMRPLIIYPDGAVKDLSLKNGEVIKVCNDFKAGDTIDTNVEIIKVSNEPNLANCKYDETIHYITAFDGKHHFMWATKASTYPNAGEKKRIKATIKKQVAQIDVDVPAYSISSIKLLMEKKS